MGLINYSYEIIGDCNNTSEGQFSLFYTASTPPLRIVWTNPTGGTLVDEVLTTYPHVVPNLSEGTYVFSLIDSDPSTNNSCIIQSRFQITKIIFSGLGVCRN